MLSYLAWYEGCTVNKICTFKKEKAEFRGIKRCPNLNASGLSGHVRNSMTPARLLLVNAFRGCSQYSSDLDLSTPDEGGDP